MVVSDSDRGSPFVTVPLVALFVGSAAGEGSWVPGSLTDFCF
jgi:hypothetical protein